MIVEIGGQMFNVTHLNITDWVTIFLTTMIVLVVGEIKRLKKS